MKPFCSLLMVMVIGGLPPALRCAQPEMTADGTNANLFPPLRLLDGKTVRVDLKYPDQSKAGFGVDYRVHLLKHLARTESEAGYWGGRWNFDLRSEGFVGIDAKSENLNNILNQADIELSPLLKIPRPGRTFAVRDWETDTEVEAIAQEFAYYNEAAFWIFNNTHFKHETTQDFRDYNLALGTEFTFNTSYLNDVVNSAFRWLQLKNSDLQGTRQLHFSIGYDYVFETERDSDQALLRSESDIHRLVGKAFWGTQLFNNKYLEIAYLWHYEVDAPADIRAADKANNSFFMATFEIPVPLTMSSTSPNSSIFVRYMNGKLPPNYQNDSMVGGGLSIKF